MATAEALSSSITITFSAVTASTTTITSSAAASSPEAATALSSFTTTTTSDVAASEAAAAPLSSSTTSVVAAFTEATTALSSSSTISSAVAASTEAATTLSSSTTITSTSPEVAKTLSSSTTITSFAVAASPEASTNLSSSTNITSAIAASPEAATDLSSSTTITSSVVAASYEAATTLSSSTTITSVVAASPEVIAASSSSTTTVTSAVAASPTKPRLRGVVFDMDGTLTVPVIDFQAMHKAVLGDDEYVALKSKSPAGIDILRHVENWSPEKQQKAYEIIVDYERQGLDRLQIMPGASELCDFLNSMNIRRGLITRNFKESVDFFHQRFGMEFSPAVSREFSPCKPDPAPLLHICTAWKIPPNEVMMIGDSLKDDVGCGKRAGAYTCLLDQAGKYDAPEYANVEYKPDYKVSSLAEVYSLLEANFDLTPCNSRSAVIHNISYEES